MVAATAISVVLLFVILAIAAYWLLVFRPT